MLTLRVIFRLHIIVFLLSAFRIEAQEPKFTHYSVDNGLPSSQVHDIIQDKYGYLWFTTDGGLSRYDGYSFKNYTTQDGLTDNSLFKFFPQENGDIWCTTFNKSIFCISGHTPLFKPYKFNKTLQNLSDNLVCASIYFSKDLSTWMSFNSMGTGYIKIDSAGGITNRVTRSMDSKVDLVLFPNKGNFFYLTFQGASDAWQGGIKSCMKKHFFSSRPCYFKKKNCAIFTSISELHIQRRTLGDTINISTSYEPISLGEVNDSLFWVGFRYGGVSIFDLSGKCVKSFLAGKSVTALYIDKHKGYWLSTLEDGVFHANNTSVAYYQNGEKTTNWIHSLTQDGASNLWIGYYNGDVSYVSGEKTVNTHISLVKRPATVNYHPASKKIYFSTDDGFFSTANNRAFFDTKIGLLGYYIQNEDSILLASYGRIYLFHKGKLSAFEINNRANDICFHENRYYIATNKGLFTLQNQKTEIVPHALLNALKISDIDSWNKKLLLATKGSGVMIKEKEKIYVINTKTGLSSNIVNEVYPQNDTTFWACTSNGLNRILFNNDKKIHVTVISTHEGLINNEVTDIEIIRDTVWVGARGGLCCFPLAMLGEKPKPINYYLVINSIKANDSDVSFENANELNYKRNRIEFGFKAISFLESSPLVYRYKLVGLEKKWNYTQSLSSIYTSLPPGNYTFAVQVKGTNATWEMAQQQFAFVILPPFWKTWWFILFVTLILGVLVYLFFKLKIFTYNRDITRELLRQILKRLTRKTHYVVFREQGKDIRIPTTAIYYVKADGNYIEIHTYVKKYVIRYKIGEFLSLVPDPLEYIRISRSCIVRLDKIEEKGKKDLTIKGEKIPVGETYLDQLKNIKF